MALLYSRLQPTMITKVDERTGDVPSRTRPRSIRHMESSDASHRDSTPSPVSGRGQDRRRGAGRRRGGGGCGTERSEELNAKMLHNSPLVFPTGRFIIQGKKNATHQPPSDAVSSQEVAKGHPQPTYQHRTYKLFFFFSKEIHDFFLPIMWLLSYSVIF